MFTPVQFPEGDSAASCPDKVRRLPFRGKLAFLVRLPQCKPSEPGRRASSHLEKRGESGVVFTSRDSDCEACHLAP